MAAARPLHRGRPAPGRLGGTPTLIAAYHLAGTLMEWFKIPKGSWIYPEAGWLRLAGVPLFTGFMYAAIGSYMTRAWRVFEFRFANHPKLPAVAALGLVAYVNFFTHHYGPDIRLALFAVSAVLFARTTIYYRVDVTYRSMPLLLGALLVTAFIWLAENIGTYAHAWVYPKQAHGWVPVGPEKFGSWYLLMLLSYAMVACFNGVQAMAPKRPAPASLLLDPRRRGA